MDKISLLPLGTKGSGVNILVLFGTPKKLHCPGHQKAVQLFKFFKQYIFYIYIFLFGT